MYRASFQKNEKESKLLKRLMNYLKSNYLIKKNPISYARSIGVEVGEDCRLLGINRGTFGSEPFLIKIGNHVTITSGVKFINHDGGVWVFRNHKPDIDIFGPIIIGDNVFIGLNTIIMPNVKIGNNVVIAAGSVVTKSIEADKVVAGVPARIIKEIDQYHHKVEQKADYIKGKTKLEKREYLIKKYMFENGTSND